MSDATQAQLLAMAGTLLGVLIGGVGSSMAAWINARHESRRHRMRLAYESALEEWKTHLNVGIEAAKLRGGGRFGFNPAFTYVYGNLKLLELMEKGPLTPEVLKQHLQEQRELENIAPDLDIFMDRQVATPIVKITLDTFKRSREALMRESQIPQLEFGDPKIVCPCACRISIGLTLEAARPDDPSRLPAIQCPKCRRGFRVAGRIDSDGALTIGVVKVESQLQGVPLSKDVVIGIEAPSEPTPPVPPEPEPERP
jgi:hypothetical protein